MTEKKKKLLTKHDITGKLGDRTLGEIFYGPPRGAGTPSPVAVGVAYVAGKAGLLDDKPKKVKPKLSKAQKEGIRLKALSQLHKLKKQLVKAKTKKKQAELKRSIRKQQKLIK